MRTRLTDNVEEWCEFTVYIGGAVPPDTASRVSFVNASVQEGTISTTVGDTQIIENIHVDIGCAAIKGPIGCIPIVLRDSTDI